MALLSFFKIPEHRTFNFVPRYYDERKEKLEKRVKDAERELGIKKEEGEYHSSITRGSMRGYMHKNVQEQKRSNIRLIAILGVLALLIYLLIFR